MMNDFELGKKIFVIINLGISNGDSSCYGVKVVNYLILSLVFIDYLRLSEVLLIFPRTPSIYRTYLPTSPT